MLGRPLLACDTCRHSTNAVLKIWKTYIPNTVKGLGLGI